MIYFIIAALVVMLDQITKYYITLYIAPGISVPLIPGLIRLTYHENTGAAFSFLSDMRWLLVVTSAVAVILIIWGMIRYRDKINPVGKLALAAVLGGAVSHLLDRAILGYVVDFFEFEFVRFAIFNVADCFITVGGIVFCIWYLLHSRKDDGIREDFMLVRRKKADADAADGTQPEDDGGTDQN
ncbi:MAG: signal peptidase II [Clostridiales bacterium]|nr:signal peptidase II [Clostridiales bacterium]